MIDLKTFHDAIEAHANCTALNCAICHEKYNVRHCPSISTPAKRVLLEVAKLIEEHYNVSSPVEIDEREFLELITASK